MAPGACELDDEEGIACRVLIEPAGLRCVHLPAGNCCGERGGLGCVQRQQRDFAQQPCPQVSA